MTDYKETLLKIHENLNILQEREAKYGGCPPLDLINEIHDHKNAIAFTEQALDGHLSETEWREALKPILFK